MASGNHKRDDGQILRESLVYAKTKVQDLSHVKHLNLWGSELSDVSIVSLMDNVEIISLSVNKVNTLVDFSYCANLQELYLRKNNLQDLEEIIFLKDLKKLKLLFLADNPCSDHPFYKPFILRVLPNLLKLDDEEITYRDRQAAKSMYDPALNDLHQRAHNLLFESGVKNPKYIDDSEFNNDSQRLNQQHQQVHGNDNRYTKNRLYAKDDNDPKSTTGTTNKVSNNNNVNNYVNIEQYKIQMDILLQKLNEVELRNNKMEREIGELKADRITQLNKESDLLLAEEKSKRKILKLEENQARLIKRVDALERKLFNIPNDYNNNLKQKDSTGGKEGVKNQTTNYVPKNKKDNITSKISGESDKGIVSKSNLKNNNIY